MPLLISLLAASIGIPVDTVGECAAPRPEWIWCDDFDTDRLAGYFEVGTAGGRFRLDPAAGIDGSGAMVARWDAGTVGAGFLHLAFGRTPDRHFRPVDSGDRDYREVYWRFFVRNAPDWTGGGGHKLTRAIVFSAADWSTAAIGHVWSGGPRHRRLRLDPASGVSPADSVTAVGYNDFRNLRWLGARNGRSDLFGPTGVGQWHCIEVAMRLNDAGRRNGTLRVLVDGALDAERTDLDWVGGYAGYGINAVFLENYWNGGAPGPRERAFDRLVVSTAPIGC